MEHRFRKPAKLLSEAIELVGVDLLAIATVWERLEGNSITGFGVSGFINDPHPASTELADQLIVTKAIGIGKFVSGGKRVILAGAPKRLGVILPVGAAR